MRGVCARSQSSAGVEQRSSAYNERAGETGDTRENPPTNGIVHHDSHLRKSGVNRPGVEPVLRRGSVSGGVEVAAEAELQVGVEVPAPRAAGSRSPVLGVASLPHVRCRRRNRRLELTTAARPSGDITSSRGHSRQKDAPSSYRLFTNLKMRCGIYAAPVRDGMSVNTTEPLGLQRNIYTATLANRIGGHHKPSRAEVRTTTFTWPASLNASVELDHKPQTPSPKDGGQQVKHGLKMRYRLFTESRSISPRWPLPRLATLNALRCGHRSLVVSTFDKLSLLQLRAAHAITSDEVWSLPNPLPPPLTNDGNTVHTGRNLVSKVQRRSTSARGNRSPRENPPTSGIVRRHDSHMRISGERPRRESNPVRLGGRRPAALPTWQHTAASQTKVQFQRLAQPITEWVHPHERSHHHRLFTCLRIKTNCWSTKRRRASVTNELEKVTSFACNEDIRPAPSVGEISNYVLDVVGSGWPGNEAVRKPNTHDDDPPAIVTYRNLAFEHTRDSHDPTKTAHTNTDAKTSIERPSLRIAVQCEWRALLPDHSSLATGRDGGAVTDGKGSTLRKHTGQRKRTRRFPLAKIVTLSQIKSPLHVVGRRIYGVRDGEATTVLLTSTIVSVARKNEFVRWSRFCKSIDTAAASDDTAAGSSLPLRLQGGICERASLSPRIRRARPLVKPSIKHHMYDEHFASSFQDKIDVKHVYTEVGFTIGSHYIRHALDDSKPIADLQGNK
ncbi:hypothetical protein PR048_001330 [Dryococelus australis]|uniref:Uncharacterized protein n=1 Tax=Dryococelus australis TaxID=614101 RepID=A0ABQ9IIF1_9NEOP|nr:hypothetical protein PR048_001330 [Dryococelus australis]